MKSQRLAAIALAICVLLMGRGATAQSAIAVDGPPNPRPETPIVKLTLRVLDQRTPTLKYRLLPRVLDQKPGNAALVYTKLGMTYTGKHVEEAQEKISKWLEMPLDQLPVDEARLLLNQSTLDELQRAARREQCEWELPIREHTFMTILLPEVQKMRDYARLLALQARLQIRGKQFLAAIETLQTGFAMSAQVGKQPTMISGLVGIATESIMLEQFEQLMQQTDDASLYWALATLPKPLIDFRHAFDTESDMLFLSYPILGEAMKRDLSVDEWRVALIKLQRDAQDMGLGMPWNGTAFELGFAAMMIKAYPDAKARLIAAGRPEAEVEKLAVSQVVMSDVLRTYLELRDRMFCWAYVPYWQAQAGLDEATKYFEAEGTKREIIPLASLLLPAVRSVMFAGVRTERRIAALQAIEAVRIHAARHGGKPPAQLSEINVVPVPLDPATNQPFEYSCEQQTITLKAKRSPAPNDQGLHYEVKFVR